MEDCSAPPSAGNHIKLHRVNLVCIMVHAVMEHAVGVHQIFRTGHKKKLEKKGKKGPTETGDEMHGSAKRCNIFKDCY